MLADYRGIGVAFLLFSGLTVFPGYTLGWLFDVLEFRRREAGFRLAISVPLAIALGPVMSYLIGRSLSLTAACWFYAALSVAAIPLMTRKRGRFRNVAVFCVVAGWCLWAAFALADLQMGRRLYFSIISFDYAVRTELVSSLSTFGLPARNPFFYPGHPVMLRYHYFWLLQSALVNKIATPYVDARQAIVAGTMWCGIGLMATIALYLRFFRLNLAGFRRQFLVAMSLLLVTGLDIIPAWFFLVLVKLKLIGILPPSVEWWNDQVDGWLYSVLWEPHYVVGVIACLLGFLVISRGRGLGAGIVAGVAFATSVGSAIYVAFVFALFLLVWSVVVLVKRWYSEFLLIVIASVTASLCSLPFLAELRGPGSGGAFLHFTVRTFFVVRVLAFKHSWETHLANLLLLPLNYFMELGLFFAVGIIEWRRLRRLETIPRNDLALAVLALVSIVVCTFLRSGVIDNNDLGWRGFLLAQFVLLIRAAQLWPENQFSKLLILAALGLAGTIYDQALLRFYAPLSDAKFLPKVAWLARDERLGDRTYANREAYEWLRAHSNAAAFVQQNPNPVTQDTFYGLYANRATLAEDIACMTPFGGDPKGCAPLQEKLAPAFAADSPESALDSACAALPMDFVVFKDTDDAWRSPGNWLWHRTPLFANSFVRIFQCPKRASTPLR